MNKKELCLLFAVIIFLFLIETSFAEVETLGVFKQNDCVGLLQTCSNCTFSNLTSVILPNGTQELISKLMTKHGVEYNYTYCNTSAMGTYIANGYSDVDGTNTVWAYDFDITYTGKALDTQTSILYIALFALLVFFLIFTIYGIARLPNRDTTTEDNLLIDINKLKYLRTVLYGVCWGLILAIMFIVSSISVGYLPDSLIGSFFFSMYSVMFVLTLPMVIILFLYLFYRVFTDREMKQMLERGVQIRMP
jgi:hypothetical protein